MRRTLAALTLLLGRTVSAPRALAQCANWLPASLSGPGYGVNGEIRAFHQWDPDGAGPDPTWLVIGGVFTSVDGVPANNIAAWDGWVWRSLGTGTNGPVDCLNTFGGALIVGGESDRAGGVTVRSVARYANSARSAMGGGLYTNGANPPAPVQALAVDNGGLYAGGNLLAPGQRFARWNGANWIAQGISFESQVQLDGLSQYRRDQLAKSRYRDDGEQRNAVHRLRIRHQQRGGEDHRPQRLELAAAGGPCWPQSVYDRGGTLSP